MAQAHESAVKIAEKRNMMLLIQKKVGDCYQSFKEFCQRIVQLTLPKCEDIKINDKYAQVSYYDNVYEISHVYIYTEKELTIITCIYAQLIPLNNEIIQMIALFYPNQYCVINVGNVRTEKLQTSKSKEFKRQK